MKFFFILLSFIIIQSYLTACSFKDPTLESLSSIKITNIKENQLELHITAVIRNPNKISATLTELKSDLFLYNKVAGTGTLVKEIKVKADDTTSVVLVINMNLPEMNEAFPKMLAEDSTLITMTGTYKVEKWFIANKVKKTSNIYMHTSEELQNCINEEGENIFKIISFMPIGIGPTASKFEITAQINNPYPFAYKLESVKLEAVIENTTDTVGKILYSTPIEIKPKESKQITLTADFLLKGFMESISKVLFGGARNMNIKGTATVSVNGLIFVLPVAKKQGLFPAFPGKF